MNTIETLRLALAYFCFALAWAFVLSLVAFLLRRQLRILFDRWRDLGRIGQCVTLVFVTGLVLYGGSKHIPPSQTNDQQNAYGPLISAASMEQLSMSLEQGIEKARLDASTQQHCTASPVGTAQTSQLQSLSPIASWRARGAWEDWQRIELPAGFAFPVGTNLITEMTVMSQGALRTTLTNTTPLVELPVRVSLEPGESSVVHGLTTANSYLIVWQNACVERDATNRVDASIELFASGDIEMTIQPTNANLLPTTTFIPAPLPEGWTGEGVDGAWATNAFPSMVSNIVEMGYEDWLTDYVGINEQNGRYKVTVTIDDLPESGPCYLECGPYKVVVKSPGAYSFPLDVCQHYVARTYPTALPLTIEYDDGYRGLATQTARTAAPASAQLRAAVPWNPYIYDICMNPCFYIYPDSVDVDQAEGTRISIWCNVTNSVQRSYRSLLGNTQLVFCNPSEAEIVNAAVADMVEVILEHMGHRVTGLITITTPPHDHYHCHWCYNPNCPCGGWCEEGCSCHGTNSNGVYCVGDPDWFDPPR